jgi:hypothetical protein
MPWLPTDAMRTVLRRMLAELDAVDQDPVDAARLPKFMYQHTEQAAEVCAEKPNSSLRVCAITGIPAASPGSHWRIEISAAFPRDLHLLS